MLIYKEKLDCLRIVDDNKAEWIIVLSRNPDKKKKYDKNVDSGYRVDEKRKGGQEAIDAIPLSVQGQVQKLITEATNEENLIQMYPGWMPFF